MDKLKNVNGILRDQNVDDALDMVLRASGSALSNYTMQKTLDDMRKAMLDVMKKSYIAGSNDTFKVMKDQRDLK